MGFVRGNAEGSIGTEGGLLQVAYQYFISANPSP